MNKEELGKWGNIDVEIAGMLSKEECQEIMKLRDDGKTSKEIADYLGRTLVVVNKVIEINTGKNEPLSEDEKKNTFLPSLIGETRPDSLKDIEESDLVQISRRLLNSIVESSGLLRPQQLNDQKIKEARLIISFINATAGAMRTKLSYFKMIGLEEKVKAIRDHSQKL